MVTRAERRALEPKAMLTNSTYDLLKKVVELILPGAGALYFTLAQIWGLPFAEEVVGSLAAIAVFCGLLLRLSARSYEASGAAYDGIIKVDENDGRRVASLILDKYEDPADIVDLDQATFKVIKGG